MEDYEEKYIVLSEDGNIYIAECPDYPGIKGRGSFPFNSCFELGKIVASAENLNAGILSSRLNNGRDYLMSVNSSEITVEDCLEAFGWNKNGIGLKDE